MDAPKLDALMTTRSDENKNPRGFKV